jgi:hypothetical protein
MSGANTGGFVLTGSPGSGYNLACGANGCPSGSGPYTDFSFAASQGPASFGPAAQSISGVTAATIARIVLDSTMYQRGATTIDPSYQYLHKGSSTTTSPYLGTVFVFMSDGSAFSGTVSVGTNAQGFVYNKNATDPGYAVNDQVTCNPTSGCPTGPGPYSVPITATPTSGTPVTTTVQVSGTTGIPPAVSQIHNAPGWHTSTNYSYTATKPYVRVVAGAGWTPSTSTYNPRQPLNAYQLDVSSPVPCTSASSGSGPSGTGTLIADGTCKWNYVSVVDYVTLTGWQFDNVPWAAGKFYPFGTVVTSDTPLRAYGQNAAFCVSASGSAPTGSTGTTIPASPPAPAPEWESGLKYTVYADGCQWVPLELITYTSGRNPPMPVQHFFPSTSTAGFTQLNTAYVGELWNDRIYQPGALSEKANWLVSEYHKSVMNVEYPPFNAYVAPCFESGTLPTGVPAGQCRIILTVAPGEGFASSMTASTPLSSTIISTANGVELYAGGTPIGANFDAAAYTSADKGTYVIGLQLQATNGPAYSGQSAHSDDETILDSILDGGPTVSGGESSAVACDAGCVIANNLIIARGAGGVSLKYPGYVLWNTIVCPSGACNYGVGTANTWNLQPTTVANSTIFGFAHAGTNVQYDGRVPPFSNTTGPGGGGRSSANYTDAPVGDSGTANWLGYTNAPVVPIPGTTYGSTASAVFVNPGSDYRPKVGGPLIGGAAAYGTFWSYCSAGTNPWSCANGVAGEHFTLDTPNFIGVARPHNGHYTIGPESEP